MPPYTPTDRDVRAIYEDARKRCEPNKHRPWHRLTTGERELMIRMAYATLRALEDAGARR